MSVSGPVITIAAPQGSDRGRVKAMVEACGIFRPDEVGVALEVFDGAVRHPGVDYHGLGAYDDGQLVGFALSGPTPCTVSTWDLYWIVVDPAAHRHGIGRMLMAATETAIRSQGGTLVVVETSSRPDYAPTRSFYHSLGYAQAARIPQYYAPEDDLIVYTKHLDPPPAAEMAPHG